MSLDLIKIAGQYQTPCFVYDIDRAASHVAKLKSQLPNSVALYYAVKANPNRAWLEAFKGSVAGLDISSGGELALARASGWAADRLSFAGPGKSDRELCQAVSMGGVSISVESHTELVRLSQIAESEGRGVRCLLRVNPLKVPRAFAMRMGGTASQFGIPEEEAGDLLEAARGLKGVEFCGVHVFAGTQCLDVDALLEGMRGTLAIAMRLSDEHGLALSEVNLGGGVGVPYFEGQQAVDPSLLSQRIAELLGEAPFTSGAFAETRFVLELGRYLTGSFGSYLTRVVDVKRVRGKSLVVLDGGMHHFFAATGNFGQVIKKNYRVSNLSRSLPPSELLAQELVGPLCTPLDSMARAVLLPPCEVGDLIEFHNAGAYAYSASPLFFLSHPTPLELMARGGELSVARRALNPDDLY
jgi:diaminopimelate decarboxylase